MMLVLLTGALVAWVGCSSKEEPKKTSAFVYPPGAIKPGDVPPGGNMGGGGMPPRGATVQVGQPAPEIEGMDSDHKPFKLSDYRGKVVLLDFWGHW
jgi:cytochrome oxidase Cu insertion factor (SCO1/SenC/PrrC family)